MWILICLIKNKNKNRIKAQLEFFCFENSNGEIANWIRMQWLCRQKEVGSISLTSLESEILKIFDLERYQKHFFKNVLT